MTQHVHTQPLLPLECLLSSTGSIPRVPQEFLGTAPALLWGGGMGMCPNMPLAGWRAILILTLREISITKRREDHSGEAKCGLRRCKGVSLSGLGKLGTERPAMVWRDKI